MRKSSHQLQISAYHRDRELVTEEDLYQLAEGEYSQPVEVVNESCGPFTGLYASFSAGNTYWRKWWLRSGSLLLFITYNCNIEEKHAESAAVNQMLATLRPKARCA